jgi:hypothetical protein
VVTFAALIARELIGAAARNTIDLLQHRRLRCSTDSPSDLHFPVVRLPHNRKMIFFNFGTLVFRVQCGNDFPAIHIKVLAADLKAVLG